MAELARQFYETMFRIWDGMERSDDGVAGVAQIFLEALAGRRSVDDLPELFRVGVGLLHAEYEELASDRVAAFEQLKTILAAEERPMDQTLANTLWMAFFPEALHLDDDPDRQIAKLRRDRLVKISKLAVDPIASPAKQVLFTSNVLLSPPMAGSGEAEGQEGVASVVERAAEVSDEQQLYWYDHPVSVGIPPENDEVLYGLTGLAEALKYEKARGTAGPVDTMRVCLSVSVTHAGLRALARPWLKAQFARVENSRFDGMEIFAFTEEDSVKLLDLLEPWLTDPGDAPDLRAVFGVDGEYGRHYSFLKALPAMWSVLHDPEVKATFKIDLDQVFPQQVLIAETGRSAFEHLTTPLWGAEAVDAQEREVELGMIAGALVNQKDIAAGLFTSDIPWPAGIPEDEDLIFFKQRPMAVSTRAELMTRYGGSDEPDGVSEALHRIHVTGGTNGIRLDALRRHRPFTPSFVGRAEDQAYLLSVLQGPENDPALRYAHASGLIMRHDKGAFAGAAVKAGQAGSYVGDLVRLFVFSAYARVLPGGAERIKALVDPFTGCFITPIPATLALLRLALHLRSKGGGTEEARRAILELAERRLEGWVRDPRGMGDAVASRWNKERRAWNAYYDALDNLEHALKNDDHRAEETVRRFREQIGICRING